MKLLVVVDTLNGMRMARSMARTFKAPEPMPRSPDTAPAMNLRPKPVFTWLTLYDLTPSGVGKLPFRRSRVASGSSASPGRGAGRPRAETHAECRAPRRKPHSEWTERF